MGRTETLRDDDDKAIGYAVNGFFVGVTVGVFLTVIALNIIGDAFVTKYTLVKDGYAHYDTTSGSFVYHSKQPEKK